MVRMFWVGVAAAALLAGSGGEARAASYAHAMTVSGQASGGVGPFGCATSGPQPKVGQYFGTGIPLPSEGYAACSLAGGIVDVAKAAGQSLAHSDVTNAFNGGVNVASADARAVEGSLGAQASDSYTGITDGFTYTYSEAGSIFTDTLSYGGAGLAYIRFGFGIDGALSVTGSGDAFTRVNYQVGTDPIYTAFVAEFGRSFTPRAINPTGVGALGGFAVGPNSLAGADTGFTFLHLVDLANPFDLSFGLYAAAYAGPGGTVVNDFFNTAQLTSISLIDVFGQPLDVHFAGASGAFYDATGVHAAISDVPEPAQWALMILGFGLAGAALRRRRQERSIQTGA